MPNVPATPIVGFRCPPELREAMERICEERGITLTDFMVPALWRAVREWPGFDD